MKIPKSYCIYLSIVMFGLFIQGCRKDEVNNPIQVQKTVLVYMAGDNSLSSYVETNLAQMEQGMKTKQSGDERLLVLADDGSANTQLLEITNAGRKVLKLYDTNLNTASVSTFQQVWNDVKTLAPANGYGLIMWSHGSGWFPPSNVVSSIDLFKIEREDGDKFTPFSIRPPVGLKMPTKAFGQDGDEWMSTEDLTEAFPDNGFEFIIFDACYMASVELLYALRNKSPYYIVSPTEILGVGLPYDTIMEEILSPKSETVSALKKICQKYFDYYEKQSGLFQSASISLISTHALSNLATTIRDLHQTLADVNPDVIQQFNRQQQYPCYDFKDAYSHTNTDSKKWSGELDSVVVVECHTKYFVGMPLSTCCGLSTYIPQANEPIINGLYQNTLWYKAINGNKNGL